MKKKLIIIVLLIIVSLFIIGMRFYRPVEPIVACDPIDNARPLCGWQNPEDMAALPDGYHVIVSEYGGQNGEKTGTLALLDLKTEIRKVLYPQERNDGASHKEANPWGDPNCVEMSDQEFSPHGIHFSQRADGSMQLLVVQHRGRESVEMFEVTDSADGWALAWRGCVIAPVGSTLNDVVATPDGGFLVTHMMTKRSSALGQFAEFLKASFFGIDGGYVLVWQPNEGFQQLANSEGAIANGIEIAPDGETVFVNYSMNGELRRINRHSGEVEANNEALPPLDNVTWTPDGRLLVAAGLADTFFEMMAMMACTSLEAGTCPGAFAIIAVDPATLEGETIYEGGPNTPSGAGTVGLQVNDGSLLIGTFAGDRIVRVTP